MLLAGDVGGTKTLLGLFERGTPRPREVAVREYATLDYEALWPMIEEFLADGVPGDVSLEATVIGVAGPVRNDAARLTNVPWHLSAPELATRLDLPHVSLLNDVEAMGYSVEALYASERVLLREGSRQPSGNGALLTVGTGLGQAILHRVGNRFIPLASEGGHADFAARNEREIALLRALRPRFGRVEIERVASGPGLANIARVVHPGGCPLFPPDLLPADEPAEIAHHALEGRCDACREALDIFVDVLGAAAGNLALTVVASGGIYLGGGVPGKILPALQAGSFLAAFDAKAPLDDLLRSVPVTVITTGRAGLLGAAVHASTLAS